ncbi:MAG TPA: hypothetical protein VNY81_05710 [Candidatus Saccharimonadales bacterium]|jgi:hypothetical protein|nr:hypothetical protein [Candidatus Saccharimonadales bacterium]
MAKEFGFMTRKSPRRIAAALILAAPLLAASLPSQEKGPLPSPPATEASQPTPVVQPAAAASAPRAQSDSGGISHEPPALPVEQIIQKFGDRELEFKKERDNYTYNQSFVVQVIDNDDQVAGEYRMTSDILFTPDGKRYEKVTSAPPPTLERAGMSLSQQDLDDVEHVQPFVLTTTDLPKYDVKYVGREQLDELSTYVFDVAPKKIEKNQRYFQGRIWVYEKDLNIVKSDGKAVPDIIKKNNENIFPRFETFRENIEGNYWFPTYTRADDVLHFSSGPIHMRMKIRYTNYKRFGATIRIGTPVEIKEEKKPPKP